MNREYDDYLRDMLENAELALTFVNGMEYDKFFEDEKSKYESGLADSEGGFASHHSSFEENARAQVRTPRCFC